MLRSLTFAVLTGFLLEAAGPDRAAIQELISKKADVNAREGDGSTALLWAAYRDDLESVHLLLNAGAKVNLANDLGVTPLWAACQNGSLALVQKLLDAGADPNIRLEAGETPLMVAARSGKTDIVRLLLSRKADPNLRATRNQTALMWAVSQKHAGAVKALLDGGADVHARSDSWTQMMAVPPHGYRDYNKLIPHGGNTAILFAARVGDLESAQLLVAAGANVNDADAWGVTPVVLAAHSGFADIVEFLLAKGADPNKAEAGFTALQEAIMRRDERMAAALLAKGADPNAPLKTWTPTRRSSKDYHFPPPLVGATPFWLAARFTQPSMMRLLLKHGANPQVVHRSQFVAEKGYKIRTEMTTPLMAALGMGGGAPWVAAPPGAREALTLETVKLAVELGVDLNAANTDGRMALDAAEALGYESVTRFLAERGAKRAKALPRDSAR